MSEDSPGISEKSIQNISLGLGSALIILATFVYYGSGNDGEK
jgi:hypothetical protein